MIEFKAVNYSINDKPILENIDLTIAPHEFVAIIGPNGAGKSTLIKILLNIIPGYQGKVLIEGIDHKVWLKTNRIGYLPQKEDLDHQFPATTLDIVLMGKAAQKGLFNRFNASDIEQARDYLDRVGIKHLANQQIGSLSGGEWQRTLLARALITGSNYLILDEPEAGIDKKGVTGFFDLLAELNQAGKTIITISHDLHTLNQYCTFLVCLNKSLHCHTETELITAEHIHLTFGEGVKLIEKDY
jgi:zinc transport system ATP-binding protein